MSLKRSEMATRAAAGFILDQVRAGRGPLGFLDALILMAVTQANVEPVLRDPVLNRQYATYDCPPPDHLRRPISMHAASESLGVPFETLRRRVGGLALLGLCRVSPAGVIVPTWVLKLGSHRASSEANYERTRQLYFRLARLGLAPPRADAPPWDAAAPLRAVARVTSEYLLRVIATASQALGDVVSMVVWLEILRSTHAGLPDEIGLDTRQCMPVQVAAVARQIGIPTENVRRRVSEFVDQGVCERTERGVILNAQSMERPEVLRIIRDNHRELTRLFTQLGRLGIVAAWEGEIGDSSVA